MTTLFHKEFALIGTKLDDDDFEYVIKPIKQQLVESLVDIKTIYQSLGPKISQKYKIDDVLVNGAVNLEILLHFYFLHLYNLTNLIQELLNQWKNNTAYKSVTRIFGTFLESINEVVSYDEHKVPVFEQVFSRFLFTFQHNIQKEDIEDAKVLATITDKLSNTRDALDGLRANLTIKKVREDIDKLFNKPNSPLLQSPGDLPISLPPRQTSSFTNNNQGGFIPTEAEDLDAVPSSATRRTTEVTPMFAAIPVGPASSSSAVILLDDIDEDQRKAEKERKRAQKKAKKNEDLARQRAEMDAQFARRQAELDAQFAAKQQEVLNQTTALLNQVQASSSSSAVPQYSNLNARPKHKPEYALWYASLSPEDKIKENDRRKEKKKQRKEKKKQVTKVAPPSVDSDAEKRARRAEYMRNRRAQLRATQNQPSSSSTPLTDDVETTSSSSSESTKKSKGKRVPEVSPILPGDIEFKANFKLSDGYVENLVEFSKHALVMCLYEESDTIYTEKVLSEYFENFLKDYKNTTAEKQARTESKIGFNISDIDTDIQEVVKTNARNLISVFLQSLIALLEKNKDAHPKLLEDLKKSQSTTDKIPNWIPSDYFISMKRRPQIRQVVFPLIVLKAAMNLIAYIGLNIDDGILPVAPIGAVKTKASNLAYQHIFKNWIQERWPKQLQVDGANALRDIANVTLFAENPHEMFVFENLVALPNPPPIHGSSSSSSSSSSETPKQKTKKFTEGDIEFFNKVSPTVLNTDDERESFLINIVEDALFIIFKLSVDATSIHGQSPEDQKKHITTVKEALIDNNTDKSSFEDFCKEIINEPTDALFAHLKANVSNFLDEFKILCEMQTEASKSTNPAFRLIAERKNQFINKAHAVYVKDNSVYIPKTYLRKAIKAASVAICFVKLAVDFYYGSVMLPSLSDTDTYNKELHRLQSQRKSFDDLSVYDILPEEILDSDSSKNFITFVSVYFNIPALSKYQLSGEGNGESDGSQASESNGSQASESDDSQEDASFTQNGTEDEASDDSETYLSNSDSDSTSSSSEEAESVPSPKKPSTPPPKKRSNTIISDDDELAAFMLADKPG